MWAGGAETTWYGPRPAPGTPSDLAVVVDGVSFRGGESGSASVKIESAAGRQEGIFVEYRRYLAGTGDRLVIERWPDGIRGLLGRPVAPEDLQLWTRPVPEA